MIRRAALLLAVAAAACGPSSADVRQAREATYQAEFAVVWNAVAAEIHERYPDGIKAEDGAKGYIETKWKPVESSQEATAGESDLRAGKSAASICNRTMFRVLARIDEGGPPWHVSIDGEAALYRPDMSVLTPYKHGAIDEPSWVPGRIDGIRVAIHERLKQYAVKRAGP